MDKKLIIFGTGSLAELAHFYFTHDSPYDPVAFTVSAEHQKSDRAFGLPVVAFEEVEETYPPEDYALFVAVGYRRMNQLRAEYFERAKEKGYELASYVSSKATHWQTLSVGVNTFIFEANNIQPFTTVGDNVIMWSGNHIGHHGSIGDHVFVTSHVVISGHVRVEPYCFFGVNATVRDAVTIGARSLIGAGALVMRSTEPGELYVPARTKPDSRRTDEIDF